MKSKKIDLDKSRTPEQLKDLLDAVKRNDSNTLTKDEQEYYIQEIEFQITGERFSRDDIKQDIEEGMPDIPKGD